MKKNGSTPFISEMELSDEDSLRGQKKYTEWHWGVTAKRVIDWNDPDMPHMLIECGRLIRLHIRAPMAAYKRHPRRERDTMIQFSKALSSVSHVAFDPDHPLERLYFLIPPRGRAALKKQFWDKNTVLSMSLNDLASIAGGKHGRMQGYPDVLAKPVGVLIAVVYYTQKQGDENPDDPRSYYIHQLGEVTGSLPFLCVDEQGRFWCVGGNTTSPPPGITD